MDRYKWDLYNLNLIKVHCDLIQLKFKVGYNFTSALSS